MLHVAPQGWLAGQRTTSSLLYKPQNIKKKKSHSQLAQCPPAVPVRERRTNGRGGLELACAAAQNDPEDIDFLKTRAYIEKTIPLAVRIKYILIAKQVFWLM